MIDSEIQKYLERRLQQRLARAGFPTDRLKYIVSFRPSDPGWVKPLVLEIWCENNCQDAFWVCNDQASFMSADDAMFFKLVHGGL